MDLARTDRRTRQFVTNVGLITSDGPHGPNVMAAEWTHHLSYAPGLIAVSIHAGAATADNIRATREFGVNLAAEGQHEVSSLAGGTTGKETDKPGLLRELGVEFYPATRIRPPMIRGAAMNAECRLRDALELGDHITFIGEVVEMTADEAVRPLLLHNGRYWTLGAEVARPSPEERQRLASLIDSYAKEAATG